MPNSVDLLLADALNTPVPPSKIAGKEASVSAASAVKKLDFTRLGAARSTGKGSIGVDEFQWDMQNLHPGQIQQKYGAQAAQEFMRGMSGTREQTVADYNALNDRHAGNVLWDTSSGALSGAVGGLGGLVALGTGMVNDNAGAWVSDKVQGAMEWTESVQSDGINAARRQQRLESSLDIADNAAQMEQEVNAGGSEFVAGLKRWGRDTVDTVANSTDPAMFVQGTSEAAGSLLAGGPIAKGLKVIGKGALALGGIRGAVLGRGPMTAGAAKFADRVDNAAWPAAIAGLEGGGAYSGTVDEIMNMKPEDLAKNSPHYQGLIDEGMTPEQAQLEIATDAGMRAAAVTGTVAALTAGLSRWAETPLKVPTARAAAQNVVLNEPLEESIQGSASQLATNEAIAEYADRNRTLSEGVGEQTALGALYGAGSAAGVQSAGSVVNGLKAGRQAYKSIVAAGGVGNMVKKAAAEQAQAQILEADKASPVNEARVQEAAATVRSNLPDWSKEMRRYLYEAKDVDENQRTDEYGFLERLSNGLNITDEEVSKLPATGRAAVADAPSRIKAIHNVASQIEKLPEGSPESLEAIAAYDSLTAPLRALQNPKLEILETMPDGPVREQLLAVLSVVANSINSTVDRRANKAIDNMVKDGKMPVTEEQISDAAIQTPEGQAAAQAAVALTTMRPGSGTVAMANQLLKHASNGFLTLTAPQQAAVRATLKILQGQEAINKARDVDKMTPGDVVNGNIISDPKDPLVVKRTDAAGMSARQHINGILAFMNSGNLKDAREVLEDFGKFAEHMRNKLDAVNKHYEGGDRYAKEVGYQALSPDLTSANTRVFYQAPRGMWVNLDNEASVRTAQNVGVESEVLTDLYNGIAEVFNEVSPNKVELLEKSTLNDALRGTVADVMAKHPKPEKKAKPAESKPESKPVAAKPEPEVKELKVVVKQPEPVAPTPVETKPVVSEEAPVVEDKPTNKEWMSGKIQKLRPDEGRARLIVGDTTISYDVTADGITLNLIQTASGKTGQGSARKAMDAFLLLTDVAGQVVSLTVAEQSNDTTRAGLMKFYNSFGFDGKGDELTREVEADPVEYQPQVTAVLEPVKANQFDVPATTGNQNTPFVFAPKNDEQKDAVDKITKFLSPDNKTQKVFVVEGKAGTGKTTIMMAALQDALKRGTPITISAISHKAKKVLEDKINEVRSRNKLTSAYVEAKSVAALLGMKMDPETGDFTPNEYEMRNAPINDAEIIVVDEASMLGQEAIDLILKYKRPSAKVIFLGDVGQLAPIGDTNVSPVFTMDAPRVRLLERVRQGEDSAILPYADVYWNNSQDNRPKSNPVDDLQREKSTPELEFLKGTSQVLDRYLGVFSHAMKTLNPNLIKIIAYNNKMGTAKAAPALRALEKKIRQHLFGENPKAFESGEMIIFNDNYKQGKTQIDNSSEFVVRKVSEKQDKVVTYINGKPFEAEFKTHTLAIENGAEAYTVSSLDPEESNRKAWTNYLNQISNEIKQIKDKRDRGQAWSAFYETKGRYADVAFSYVITSHKSQGSTYQVSIVLEDNFHNGMGANPDLADKSRGLYTAVTRAAQRAVIVSNFNPDETTAVKPEFVAKETKTQDNLDEEHRMVPDVAVEEFPEIEVTPTESVPEESIGSELDGVVEEEVEEDEAISEETTNDEAPSKDKMLEMFPNMYFAGDHSLSSSMAPVEDLSRGISKDNPAFFVQDVLESDNSLVVAVGVVEHVLTKPIAKAYKGLLDENPDGKGLGGIIDVMRTNLANFLDKMDSKGVSVRSKIKAGMDANRWKEGKALNIMTEDMVYNEQLLQSAALAGLQWVLETRQAYNNDNDDSDFIAMTGVKDANKLPESIKDRLSTGQTVEEIKPILAAKIREYWGLKPRSDQDKAYANGISEAVAAEVLTALWTVELLDVDAVEVTEEMGLPPLLDAKGKPRVNKNGTPTKNKKTFNRYIVISNDLTKAVEPYPTAINDAMLITSTPVRFIDGDIPPVANNQMNNPDVQNTADQKKTLEVAGKTEHKINSPMLHALAAIGEAGIVRWLGGRKPSWSVVDADHEQSLKGREQNARNAFNEIFATVAEMGNRAQKTGKSVFDTVIRYAYNMSKVGRMQMLGSYNGQSNKLTRDVIMPTWSTLDLVNNDKHQEAFFLAIAQHLDDVKLNKVYPADAIASTKADLAGKYAPLVQYLQEWVAGRDLTKTPVAGNKSLDIEKILEMLDGKDLGVAGLNSFIEYARFLNADEAGKASFRTGLYLEADGVTNGPIMAMMMLTTGGFSKEWLGNVAKGGVGFGSPKAIYALDDTDKIDLYQTATSAMVTARNNFKKQFGTNRDDTKIKENLAALEIVMESLFDGDVVYNDKTKELVFKRGIAKNPLTITLYGSMPQGIAGNFASRMMDALHERRTEIGSRMAADKTLTAADILFNGDQDKFRKYEDALNLLTSEFITQNKEGGYFRAKRYESQTDWDVLTENFLHGLVMPLVTGIRDTVGDTLMESMRALRQATQVQSIFLEKAYTEELNKVLAQKKLDDPSRKSHDFLSQDDLNEISRAMTVRFPNIKTSSQVFRVAKTKRDVRDSSSYSEGLDGRHRTGAGVYAPANAGVSGIASLVIGFGDGYMVQVAVQDPAMTGVLAVFDGINLPLDTMEAHGTAANRAAYEAFLNNPMRAVQVAYDGFLKQLKNKPVDVDEKMLTDLAWAFQVEGEPALDPAEMAEALDSSMNALSGSIDFMAKSIEARHLAMQDVQMFVDHMAASGSVFTNQEGMQEELTKDQLLAKLNERYNFHMKNVSDKVPMTLIGADTFQDVELVRSEYFPNLAQSMDLTPDQTTTMNMVMKSLTTKGYMLVSGTKEAIVSYRLKHGLPVDEINDNDSGFISPTEKRIYLINAQAETLTHELVHAATYEKLLAHYAGQSNSEVSDAVQELELMMKEFLEMPTDVSMPFELQQAMLDAKAEIKRYQNAVDMDPVVMAAGALNEFMAWSLSNQLLMDKLKETPVPLFVKWAKGVVKFVQQMFSGKDNSGDNFLSNIQFNANILIRSQKPLTQGFAEVTLHHRTTAPQGLMSVRALLERTVLDKLKQLEKIDHDAAAQRVSRYITEAGEVADSVANVFNLSDIEKTTLASVMAALGTDIKLDSNVLTRMQKLYEHAQVNLRLKHFINPDAADHLLEAHEANDKLKIILGRGERRVDPQGLTTLLPVFIGMSMVSQEFRDALGKLPVPPRTEKNGTVDEQARQLGTDAMESLSKFMAGEGKAVNMVQALDALNAQLYMTLANERSNLDMIEETSTRGLAAVNGYLRDLMTAASDKGMAKGKSMSTSPNKFQRGVGKALQLTSGIASEKNGDLVAEGVLKTAERTGLNNAFLNIMKDFIGRTSETADIYDLIKPVRVAVQQIRQQFRESVPKIISDKFSRAITKEEYATMMRAMAKTDLAALMDSMSRVEVGKVFSEAGFLDSQIEGLENQLRNLDPRHFTILQTKMKQLAAHQITGSVGPNLLRNAHAVARLWNENVSSRRQPVTPEMEAMVDQLITLYAIDNLSTSDKASMASLVRSEKAGMEFIMSYLSGQRRTEAAKAKLGKAKQNHFKGFMHSLPTKTGHVIVADDAEYSTMIQKGYTRVRDYEGSNMLRGGTRRGYYYSTVPARAAFAQGLMQNVDQSAYGVDPATGFSTGTTAGRITGKRLVAQLAQTMHRERGTVENLMPVYNERGVVVAFEQSVDPLEMAKLEGSEQIHEMLGVWRGRQVEERFAAQKNKVLIDTLKKNWDANKSSNPDLYVNLFDSRTLDNVERDAVALFSDETKAYAKEVFGPGVLMVRKSQLEDLTGYRNPSVSDFWTNINRFKPETNKAIKDTLISTFGVNAYKNLVNIESMIQGFTSDLRTMIVVKSMVVPMANMLSNVYQLMSRGVNPIRIAKEAPAAVSQLNSYLNSRVDQIRLEAELRAVKPGSLKDSRLRAQIKSITDSHKRLSIWPLIEAGEFSTVADVGLSRDDLELSSGRINQWLEQKVDQLPSGLKTAAKYGMVSKDTALFHGLQKSVQYGDFVAKSILYNHLMKNENHTREQALARITEEFVNYDRLPGRTRGGLENMGLLWFYNFKIRSTKVALSTLRNNPLHALLVATLPTPMGIGTPIDENIIAKGLEGQLGWSIGPGMALRAPMMNPWAELVF